jgi:purine nucleoside phosphorylase
VPLEELYAWCQIARDLLVGPHAVARVIARPFTSREKVFVRTKDRRDFSLAPPAATYLDVLHGGGVPVLALGKISEVFAERGVTAKIKVVSNDENLALVLDLLRGRSSRADFSEGLLFTNLVDFDMVWGHRNDVDGFARGLEAMDAALPEIISALAPDDRLIVTADHGVDPTTPSTDHSREYVPLLLYPRPPGAPAAVYEGTLADTGATAYESLTGENPLLSGDVIGWLRPRRGWRRYTPAQPSPTGGGPDLPGRVGAEEAADAARWLKEFLGIAPEVAIVLGSGLTSALVVPTGTEVRYQDVPHWVAGEVPGHPQVLMVTRWEGRRVALLKGRAHGYEGFDLSELQLQIRSMAAWGVRRFVITSACGALSSDLAPGKVMIVGEVLDLQHPRADGSPVRLPASDNKLLDALLCGDPVRLRLSSGTHASVPGPNYETAAELAVLRNAGAATVSMSVAAEVRAARDEGLDIAVLVVVANAGETSHEEVLSATVSAGETFAAAVETVLSGWGSRQSVESQA